MVCPRCDCVHCWRSHRKSLRDYALAALGLRPWRCDECKLRFVGNRVPLRYLFVAHCTNCGGLELERIPHRYGEGDFKFLWRALRTPAFRCPRCRCHLYTYLPHRQLPARATRNRSVA